MMLYILCTQSPKAGAVSLVAGFFCALIGEVDKKEELAGAATAAAFEKLMGGETANVKPAIVGSDDGSLPSQALENSPHLSKIEQVTGNS